MLLHGGSRGRCENTHANAGQQQQQAPAPKVPEPPRAASPAPTSDDEPQRSAARRRLAGEFHAHGTLFSAFLDLLEHTAKSAIDGANEGVSNATARIQAETGRTASKDRRDPTFEEEVAAEKARRSPGALYQVSAEDSVLMQRAERERQAEEAREREAAREAREAARDRREQERHDEWMQQQRGERNATQFPSPAPAEPVATTALETAVLERGDLNAARDLYARANGEDKEAAAAAHFSLWHLRAEGVDASFPADHRSSLAHLGTAAALGHELAHQRLTYEAYQGDADAKAVLAPIGGPDQKYEAELYRADGTADAFALGVSRDQQREFDEFEELQAVEHHYLMTTPVAEQAAEIGRALASNPVAYREGLLGALSSRDAEPPVAHLIGTLHERGIGYPQDPDLARLHYRTAAEGYGSKPDVYGHRLPEVNASLDRVNAATAPADQAAAAPSPYRRPIYEAAGTGPAYLDRVAAEQAAQSPLAGKMDRLADAQAAHEAADHPAVKAESSVKSAPAAKPETLDETLLKEARQSFAVFSSVPPAKAAPAYQDLCEKSAMLMAIPGIGAKLAEGEADIFNAAAIAYSQQIEPRQSQAAAASTAAPKPVAAPVAKAPEPPKPVQAAPLPDTNQPPTQTARRSHRP